MSDRTKDELYDEIDRANQSIQEHGGSQWPGMSYEEGVDAALRWVTGDYDEPPMGEQS